MDSQQRREMLERNGFGKDFIDEILTADRQAEEAGVTDEFVRRTIDNMAPKYEPTGKTSWLQNGYQRAVDLIRKYF